MTWFGLSGWLATCQYLSEGFIYSCRVKSGSFNKGQVVRLRECHLQKEGKGWEEESEGKGESERDEKVVCEENE